MKKRRILSFLLAAVLILGSSPVSAAAESPSSEILYESEDELELEEQESLASTRALTEPVEVTSMETVISESYQQYVISNELENFDPSVTDYTVMVKNGSYFTSLTLKIRTSREVTGVSGTSENGWGAYFSKYEDSEGIYYNGGLSFAQWDKTDWTIKINYGTTASPRYKTYTIHIIADSETDGNLEQFDVTAYKGNEKMEPVTVEASNTWTPERQVFHETPDKLVIDAVPASEETELKLSYTRYDEENPNGTAAEISIEGGTSVELTDCFKEFQMGTYDETIGITVDVSVTTVPSSGQQGRTYSKGIRYGNYYYGDFHSINGFSIPSYYGLTVDNKGVVQPDGTAGYKQGVYDYSVTLYDKGYGTAENYFNLSYMKNSGTSCYAEFDGKEYTINQSMNGNFSSQEPLVPGEHKTFELKMYKDETRDENECQVYTFDVNLLPLLRLEDVTTDDDNVLITSNVSASSGYGTIQGYIINDQETGTINLTAPEGAVMRWDDAETGEIIENGPVTVEAGVRRSLYLTGEVKSEGDTEGTALTIMYTLNFTKAPESGGREYIDYWPATGQFVNQSGWGSAPEYGFESIGVSLGGFGGYLTTYFADGIENNPKNVGGIDFMVQGNAFVGNSEPGNVLVSEDGVTWYSLAGGYHYEDDCIWNYEMTYACEDPYNDDIEWEDNQGNSGTISKNGYHSQPYYPLTENYGKYRTEENNKQYGGIYENGVIPSKYTVKGTLLPGRVTTWGYADATGMTGTVPETSPYNGAGYFDIDWAVDDNGHPVKLDKIYYVKVQNATNAVLPAVGELSTEVCGVSIVSNTNDTVERTAPVSSIVVNGQTITVTEEEAQDGIVERTVYYADEADSFDVSVSASGSSGKYTTLINNTCAKTRHFDKVPEHKMIRVITQDGNNAPVIYYITLEQSDNYQGMTLTPGVLYMNPGESEKPEVNFLPQDPDDTAVTWESSDTEVATVDEEGNVTAKAAGTAEIKVTCPSIGISTTATVQVGNVIEEIRFSSFNGMADDHTIQLGKTGYLVVEFFDKDGNKGGLDSSTLEWSTSDSEVLSITNISSNMAAGWTAINVQANAPGTSTLMVKTAKGVKYEIEVTVPEGAIRTAVLAVEKFTIGQGYLVEPIQVEFHDGDTVDEVVTKALDDLGYEYTYTGVIGGSDFYLASIKGADNGTFDPPAEVQEMNTYEKNVTGENPHAPDLQEFSYGSQSGWYYFVNDVAPSVGMGAYQLKDGDVIRLQFTLNGLGADLGDGSDYSEDEAIPVAKKSELTKRVADWNMNADYFLNIQKYSDIYAEAVEVLNTFMASQEEVDALVEKMPYNEAVPVTGLKVTEGTEETDSLELYVGEERQLTAVVQPADASDPDVSWSSSNGQVVTVDRNGKITAAGEGDAVLTVTAGGSELGKTPVTAEVSVTVKKTDEQIAKEVEDQIAALPAAADLTLEDAEAVEAAREAYEGLTEAQKALVTNGEILEAAEARITELEEAAAQEEADKKAARAVEEEIAALPSAEELTLEDKAAVEAARAAYEGLTEAQRALVTNEDVLQAAEAKIAELEGDSGQEEADRKAAQAVEERIAALPSAEELALENLGDVAAARVAYEGLTEAQKTLVTNEDILQAAETRMEELTQEAEDEDVAQIVIDLIDRLGEIESLEQKTDVEAARKIYESLTEDQKALVTNLEVLEAAEEQITVLEQMDLEAAQAVEEQIAALPSAEELTLEDKEAVEAARNVYDNLTESQKDLVGNLNVLKEAEAQIAQLEESEEALAVFRQTMPEVTAKAGENSVVVEWKPIANAGSYRIYRKEAGGSFKGLANVAGDVTSYTDKTAKAGVTYYYTVKGFWEENAEGAYTQYPSNVTAKIPVGTLAMPTVATRSVNYCTVEVTWNKIVGAEKYVIYRKEAKVGTSFKSIGTVSAGTLKYRDGTAKLGVNYYYTVKAYAGSISSNYQKTVTGMAVPSSPILKNPVSSGKGVTVSWSGSKKSAGSYADGYRIFRKTAGGSWKTVGTVGASTRSFTDTTGTRGTTYYYTVRAYVRQSNGTNLWGTYNAAGVSGAKK